MLKRNTDLFIKLVLFIFLVVLFVLIMRAANELEQPIEAKTTIPITIKEEPSPPTSFEYSTSEILEEQFYKIQKWEEEHYYAAQAWKFLRQRNFSQAAACGIIGNMMIETSGGSLDLRPYVYSPSRNYYGLCQWSRKYYSGAFELPFEYQLDYLLGTISWEFDTFGRLYREDFTLGDFIQMQDPEEAALAFAKVYERCGSTSYKLRQEAAIKAYNYFNLDQIDIYRIIYKLNIKRGFIYGT